MYFLYMALYLHVMLRVHLTGLSLDLAFFDIGQVLQFEVLHQVS